MSHLQDLYHEAVLDHHKNPRNFRKLEQANRQADAQNPLCGDKFIVYIQIEDGTIRDISFTGTGCAISIASASMMTEILIGKTESEAKCLFERFLQMLAKRVNPQPEAADLGILKVFSGIREYPVRAKCATLAWFAMHAALDGQKETIAVE
jgi:nitrogen fixation protein NifU and related proteins